MNVPNCKSMIMSRDRIFSLENEVAHRNVHAEHHIGALVTGSDGKWLDCFR